MVRKAEEFITSYESFLAWYNLNVTAIDTAKAATDVTFYKDLLKQIEVSKRVCFDEIWKHTATMRCLVCQSDYKAYFKQLRNKTIEMYVSEEMCQVVQDSCTHYVG